MTNRFSSEGILKKQRGVCFYCDESLYLADATRDHFYPRHRLRRLREHLGLKIGGPLVKCKSANIVMACIECNKWKGSRMPYMDERSRFKVVFGRSPAYESIFMEDHRA